MVSMGVSAENRPTLNSNVVVPVRAMASAANLAIAAGTFFSLILTVSR
jgi:hypothetical protein